MPPRFAHNDRTALRQAVETESGEKQVEQAGVVAVLDVLEVELPVVGQRLGEATYDFHWFVEHTLDASSDFLTEVFLDGGHIVRKAPKHQPTEGGGSQSAWAVVFLAEGGGHPSLAFDTLFEGNTCEVALQVVAPRVIDALKAFYPSGLLQGNQGATMCAAVLEGIDFPIFTPYHHHRGFPGISGSVGTLLRQFYLQAQVIPYAALEDAFLLQFMGRGITIDAVGYACVLFGFPLDGLCLHVCLYSNVTLAAWMTFSTSRSQTE